MGILPLVGVIIMKLSLLVATSALALSLPANATNLLTDNFDGEAGASILNYAGFANFDVVDGTVEYLKGFPGLNCATGGCVDLDGSTGNGGRLVTKSVFGFSAGDLVSLTFDLSGSQRGSTEDVNYGFLSQSGAMIYEDVTITIGGNPFLFGDINSTNLDATTFSIPSNYGFTTFSLSFTASVAGSFKAYIGSPSADNVGVIIDNVSIDRVAPGAVPEPATWGMMIGGFALAGAAMRRRKAAVSFA
jgi:hypothetical protein